MATEPTILSERSLQEAEGELSRLRRFSTPGKTFDELLDGLPAAVAAGMQKAIDTEIRTIEQAISRFHELRRKQSDTIRTGRETGLALVEARLRKSWTQKELARRLGLREQAIQRYEAERYRSISHANFLRIASVLGVKVSAEPAPPSSGWLIANDLSDVQARKILKHARRYRWLEDRDTTDEKAIDALKRRIGENVVDYGAPSLLRTGLSVSDHADDWLLLAWRSRVAERVRSSMEEGVPAYQPTNVEWLKRLPKLSKESDGPLQAQALLRQHGIVLVVEPQIEGLGIDGAAFLVDGTPVIGITLRHDRIDNFWFTLLHEVAHVVLHFRTGLATGFFDDSENSAEITRDEIEAEADEFAGNLLIPDEVWRRSPVRVSNDRSIIRAFAERVGVHPAIVFGRLRKERGKYKIFSKDVGHGAIAPLFGMSRKVS